jgi:NitT/TauT family transport system substrate-binding protein
MNDTGVDYNTARESLNHTKYVDMPSTKAVREVYGGLANASYVSANVGALGNSSMNQFLDTFVLSDYVNTVHAKLAADPNWKPPAVNATVQLGLLQTDSHKLAAVIALDKGFYSSLGLNVVVKHYANGVALVEGFKTGEIDMGYLGLAPALLKAINDDVKINVIAGVNNEGSAVVVKPSEGITQLAELAGKHVATPGAGTVQDLLLRMLAEENHLKIVTK